jgi:hypothetical protein
VCDDALTTELAEQATRPHLVEPPYRRDDYFAIALPAEGASEYRR